MTDERTQAIQRAAFERLGIRKAPVIRVLEEEEPPVLLGGVPS